MSLNVNTIFSAFEQRIRVFKKEEPVIAIWYDYPNWGDALNPVLIEKISGKKPLLIPRDINPRRKKVFSVIGSILDGISDLCGNNNLIIWGTGFISEKGRLNVHSAEIYAVRGPLTRDLLKNQGYKCPEIFGDPALLYPKFYMPDIIKKYKLGIIPHYVDKKNPFFSEIQYHPDILLIDIQSGINNVVDNICSCQRIASSSLHGIIAADAYGIPSTWIKFSNDVIGDGFKFYDYFYSVGRTEETHLLIDKKTSIDDILGNFFHYHIDINIDELWVACPFRL